MRTPIPDDVSAEVMYQHDRTCCVCNEAGKRVQIHHIDDDPANNAIANLAVLCFDDHDKTQIRGGFGKQLRALEVTRFRDEWVRRVRERKEAADRLAAERSVPRIESLGSSSDWQPPSPQFLEVYINSLPAILREMYAQRGKIDQERDSRAAVASARLALNVLEQILLQLSAWIDPYHFREMPARDYFSQLIAERNEWNRMLVEPSDYGVRARTGTIETLAITIKEIEKAVEDLVKALAKAQLDGFKFDQWRRKWMGADPNAKLPPRLI